MKKTNVVARDQVRIPTGLIKLHKEVCLTRVFFLNEFELFLMLSLKIYFTAVNHIENLTVLEIFKALKEVYQYCIHCGFRIATVHACGDFGNLKSLIESLPGRPLINMASANEHFLEIERCIRVMKEQCRATRHILPCQKTPKLLIPRNIQASRNKVDVCLNNSENLQGRYKLMALNPGKKIVW